MVTTHRILVRVQVEILNCECSITAIMSDFQSEDEVSITSIRSNCSVRLTARTDDFLSSNRGSIPLRSTNTGLLV